MGWLHRQVPGVQEGWWRGGETSTGLPARVGKTGLGAGGVIYLVLEERFRCGGVGNTDMLRGGRTGLLGGETPWGTRL